MHVLDQVVVHRGDFDGVQFNPFLPASMTGGVSSSRAIHQNPAHDLGGGAKEAMTILIMLVSLTGESNPRFMDQRRGLQRLAGRLHGHLDRKSRRLNSSHLGISYA